jgi:hypothetical protein
LGACRGTAVYRWISLGVMMTFFAFLPLDIYAPTVNLCIMAFARWIVVSGLPYGVFNQEQAA